MARSDELTARAVRAYARYGAELDQIRDLLAIKLRQLALAYTIENDLPREAVLVTARVKTLASFLKKLERKEWPDYYLLTEVARDLIGARVVCWFIDDVYGVLEFMRASSHFDVRDDAHTPLKDYIKEPQSAGYRAVHLFGEVTYDRVARSDSKALVVPEEILCEIQLRTKLQDSWADITHEFFYKAKDAGIESAEHEPFLAHLAERLSVEDKTFMQFREVYQKMSDEKQREGEREGFRDEPDQRDAKG